LHQAELDLSYTKLIAPEDGRVTRRTVEAGNYIQISQSLLANRTSQRLDHREFQGNPTGPHEARSTVSDQGGRIPATEIQRACGQHPGSTGAQFSLLPPENAAGNYVKVVQRVPVKIVFDEIPDATIVLPLGASVVPEVRVK